MKTLTLRRSLVSLLIVFAFLGMGGLTQAATHVWQGPASGNWSVAGNWSGGVPTSGEPGGTVVEFATGTSSICNINVTVDLVHFTGSGNVITGDNAHTLTISGSVLNDNVTNDSGTNTLGSSLLPISLLGSTPFVRVNSGTLTIASNMGGPSGIALVSSGTVIFTGATNTYGGTTSVSDGTLKLNSPGVNTAVPGALLIGNSSGTAGSAVVQLLQSTEIADSSAISVLPDGKLDLNGFAETVNTLTISDGSVTTVSGAFTLNSTLSMTGGSITAGTGTLHLKGDVTATSSATSTASISAKVTLNGTTRNITVNDGPFATDFLLNGVVSNGTVTPSGLKKLGTGVFDLFGSASNTYTGDTTVDKGVLQLSQSSGITISSGHLNIGNLVDPPGSAIVRELQSSDISSAVIVSISTSGQLDMNGHSDNLGAITGGGSISLPGVSAVTVGADNSTFSFDGAITGTGTFTKAGTGSMSLSGTCNAGQLYMLDGLTTLSLASPSTATSLQVGDDTGAANSTVIRWLNNSQIAAACTLDIRSDGKLDLNNFTQTFATPNIAAGAISLGSGTLTVNGTLTMTDGSITATSGHLNLGGNINASAFGAGASITSAVTFTTSPIITVQPGTVQPELTINAVISESGGSRGLTKEGTGTLYMAGNGNSYTGTTTVNKGIVTMNSAVTAVVNGPLIIGNDFDPADSAIVRMLNFANLAAIPVDIRASGVLDENGHGENIGTLTGTGKVIAKNFFVGLGPTADFTFSGALTTAVGGGAVSKAGAGTFTLTGDFLTNPGGNLTLFVNSGALNVTGNRSAMGVQVAAIATLKGTGKVGAIFSGGLISPGLPSIATFSSNDSVTLGNTSNLSIDINDAIGQRSDKLSVPGILAINASATLTLNVTGTLTKSAYILASYGFESGAFTTINGLPPGYSVNYAYNDGLSSKNVAITLPALVTTGAASNIVNGTAKLNGTINPQGRTTSYYFEYGQGNQYGLKTASVGGLTGSAANPVSISIAGLNGGVTYHCRLVAVNNTGTYFGGDITFVTPGPSVTTSPAFSVSALTATLNGAVNPLNQIATGYYEYGLTSAFGSKTPTLYFGNGNMLVAIPFPISGLLPGKTYHYRLVAMSSAGTSRGSEMTFITKTVLAPVFQPGGQPVSLMKQTGQLATFTVNAVEGSPSPTDSRLTYQWNKNGAPIAGATSASYIIGTVALTHAGAYTCLIKNAGGSLMSGVAELGVVDSSSKSLSVAPGATATMTVSAAGNGLSFNWIKGFLFAGFNSKTLSIPLVQSPNSGDYYCIVTGPGGTANSGVTTLSVFDGAPSILTPVVMPDGISGGLYDFQIPVDTSSQHAPSSYLVTGLPPGVTYNTATGRITGRITAVLPADKSYPITMKATNAQGSTPVANTTLLVHPFPSAGLGTYSGLVDRDPLPLAANPINQGLGGFISVTITGIGSYTGKLVLAGTSYPLTGVFTASVGSTEITTTATIQRPGLGNLLVIFNTNSALGTLTGSVTEQLTLHSVSHSSMRNPWTIAAPTAKSGTYTTQLRIQNGGLIGNSAYPQGRSFATVTITPAGAVTWVGKMADGSAPLAIFTTTLSAAETFPVHLMLNAGTGSAQGTLSLTADSMVINGGRPLLGGSVDWTKNAQPVSSTDRVYRDGFPLFNLTVEGGKYANPSPGTPVLGLTPSAVLGTNNGHITFTQGGITGPEAALITRALRVTPANTADFSNPISNPATLKLTLNATTGAMNGSFIFTNGGAARTVTYVGVVIPRTDVRAGAGYFLLPGLTPTATLSPVLSGEVLLTP